MQDGGKYRASKYLWYEINTLKLTIEEGRKIIDSKCFWWENKDTIEGF